MNLIFDISRLKIFLISSLIFGIAGFGIILFMQKSISIILIFIFSFCLYATGAFGYADCESKCCCKSAMMAPGQPPHTLDVSKKTSLTMAPGCCSGSTATSCEFSRETAESLPETFPATVRSEVPNFSGIELISINFHIESAQPKIYDWGPDPWLKTKPLPVYLQIHTFLC
jgi:hypothetical protein